MDFSTFHVYQAIAVVSVFAAIILGIFRPIETRNHGVLKRYSKRTCGLITAGMSALTMTAAAIETFSQANPLDILLFVVIFFCVFWAILYVTCLVSWLFAARDLWRRYFRRTGGYIKYDDYCAENTAENQDENTAEKHDD